VTHHAAIGKAGQAQAPGVIRRDFIRLDGKTACIAHYDSFSRSAVRLTGRAIGMCGIGVRAFPAGGAGVISWDS
jgi:hypothetical protein